jgi:hypothetical protein
VRRIAGACLGLALGMCAVGRAQAAPQWNAAVDPSLCIETRRAAEDRLAFCGSAHADLILGRTRERDVGFGPYAALGTVAFEDLRGVVGASVLIPTWADLALVVSGGGLLDDSGELGFDTSVFFGVRSYNFHGTYNFAAGLVLDAQHGFGDDSPTVISLGLRVDGLALALPFLLAWGALQ